MISEVDSKCSVTYQVLTAIFMKAFAKTKDDVVKCPGFSPLVVDSENQTMIYRSRFVKFNFSNFANLFRLSLLSAMCLCCLYMAISLELWIFVTILACIFVYPLYLMFRVIKVKIKAKEFLMKRYSFEYMFLKQFDIDLLNPICEQKKEVQFFIDLCKSFSNSSKLYANNLVLGGCLDDKVLSKPDGFRSALFMLNFCLKGFEEKIVYGFANYKSEFHILPEYRSLIEVVSVLRNVVSVGACDNLPEFLNNYSSLSFDVVNLDSLILYKPEALVNQDVIKRNELLMRLLK